MLQRLPKPAPKQPWYYSRPGWLEVVCWVAIVVVMFCVVWWMIKPAHGGVCLSKHEARKLWPRQHIYWYGPDHCWSNRRGKPPRGLKIEPIHNDPIFPKHSMAQATPIEAQAPPPTFIERWYEFPSVFFRLVNP